MTFIVRLEIDEAGVVTGVVERVKTFESGVPFVTGPWTSPQAPAGTYQLFLFGYAARTTGTYDQSKRLADAAVRVTSPLYQIGTTTAATDIWEVYRHNRCVNCHGRVNAQTGVNHGAVGAVGTSANCESCHQVSGWRNTNAPSFWSGSAAKSVSEICGIVKGSAQAASRTTFLHHVGTDANGTASSAQDPLIKWAFNPTAPVGAGGGISGMSYADWGKKSMQWFDGGKVCP